LFLQSLGLVCLFLDSGLHLAWCRLYQDIPNLLPYLTTLSAVLGLARFGISGLILGPILVLVANVALSTIHGEMPGGALPLFLLVLVC
jgi:hypothetical protein